MESPEVGQRLVTRPNQAPKTQRGPDGLLCNTTDNCGHAQRSRGRGGGKCHRDEEGNSCSKPAGRGDEKRRAAGGARHGSKTPVFGPKLQSVLMTGRKTRMNGKTYPVNCCGIFKRGLERHLAPRPIATAGRIPGACPKAWHLQGGGVQGLPGRCSDLLHFGHLSRAGSPALQHSHPPACSQASAAPTMPASLRSRAGTTRACVLRYLNHLSDFLLTPPPMMISSGEKSRSTTPR